jgi:hypothetical protein
MVSSAIDSITDTNARSSLTEGGPFILYGKRIKPLRKVHAPVSLARMTRLTFPDQQQDFRTQRKHKCSIQK